MCFQKVDIFPYSIRNLLNSYNSLIVRIVRRKKKNHINIYRNIYTIVFI